MDKIKDFLRRKKVDRKFKQAGHGHNLQGDGPESSQSRQNVRQQQPEVKVAAKKIPKPTRPDVNAIAEAAERRLAKSRTPDSNLTPMQKIVKMQAQRELEQEQRKLAQQMDRLKAVDEGEKTSMAQNKENTKILYTCDLFEDEEALPKSEILRRIEEVLFEQLEDGDADPIATSVFIIYTLNKEEPRKIAIDIIQKYLQNIIENPDEQKFRRIKLSNKVFQEKVAQVKGALEFLKSVGFKERDAPTGNGDGAMERFLVIDEESGEPLNINLLITAQADLSEGKAIPIRVFRERKVFFIDPSMQMPMPDIPDEFFMRTADEIKREQQQRTEALERMTTLRTTKMRELDSGKEKLSAVTYKYTYIRIRFPNNFVLQGIFNVFEKLSALREFVSRNLQFEQGTFYFTRPQQRINNNNNEEQQLHSWRSLAELGLLPAALLYFQWDGATLAHFRDEGESITYLLKELEESAEIIG